MLENFEWHWKQSINNCCRWITFQGKFAYSLKYGSGWAVRPPTKFNYRIVCRITAYSNSRNIQSTYLHLIWIRKWAENCRKIGVEMTMNIRIIAWGDRLWWYYPQTKTKKRFGSSISRYFHICFQFFCGSQSSTQTELKSIRNTFNLCKFCLLYI